MIESTESSLLARGARVLAHGLDYDGRLLVSATPLPSGVSTPQSLGPASQSRAFAASGSSSWRAPIPSAITGAADCSRAPT